MQIRLCIITLTGILLLSPLVLACHLSLAEQALIEAFIASKNNNPKAMAAHIHNIPDLTEKAKLAFACQVIDWDSSSLTRLQRIYFAFEYGLLLLATNQKASIVMLAQTIFHNKNLSITPRILAIATGQTKSLAVEDKERDAVALDLLVKSKHFKYLPLLSYFQPFCTLLQARCCQAIRKNNLITLAELLPLAKLLNNHDANISPVLIAPALGKLECLELLLFYGGNINEYGPTTPLMCAAEHNQAMCLKRLLEAKSNVDIQNKEGTTALFFAAEHGNINCLQQLLNSQADVNLVTEDGTSPLLMAAQNGNASCVERLINAKAEVNYISIKTQSICPLRQAAQNGYLRCLRLLLNAKANLNIQDSIGYTPLNIAADERRHECMQELINAHADVDLAQLEGLTPIILASDRGSFYGVQSLIEAKANLDACTTAEYISALRQAAQNNHVNCLRLLITAQANINIQDIDGETPLTIAALHGNHQCLQELINAGADINVVNNAKRNALMAAAFEGNKCVRKLLKAKANPFLQDKERKTAQDYARINGHTEIAQLLEQAEIDYLDE